MSLSTQLRKLEKGFDGFLATFHHLRTEFSLVLPRRESIYLAPISQELTDDDRAFMEIFCAGLIRFPQLRHIDSLDTERVAHHMVMLRKCIIEFLNQCEGFGSMGQLDGRNYRILRAIALAVHQGAVHNLILLSYWCKDE